jgi:hypothetical protein
MASLKAQKAYGPAPMRVDGDAVFHTDKIVLGASPGLGAPAGADTIDFLVPAGAQLCQLEFVLDDSDTGAAFVFGVGYRPVNAASALPANASYFAAAGQTTGQAGGRLECAFKPIKFEEDVYIQLLVGTAPAGIAGNPEIHMIAGYNCVGPK